MESEKVQIKPMTLAAEEDLIDYRLGHPDVLAKQASRQIYLLDTSYLPSELQELAAQENAKRSEGLELEVARYTLALRRARKAAEAQKLQQARYAVQTEALALLCEENQREIASERKQLKLAAKKKQMHEECTALVKQLGTRPRKKAELEQLIGDIENQIQEQTRLIAAYQAESAARVEAFNKVSSAMAEVVKVEKVEPNRAESDIAALDKIISSSESSALAAGATNVGKSLDPKASVFTPVSRPAVPTTTNSGPTAGSRGAAHSRKGKSAGSNPSTTRAGTPGIAAKGNSAAGAKSRAEATTTTTKRAAASAARARSPLAGNIAPKEPNAPRAGGRRQAVNAPSQLGKSSMSMEDGEISSNASEGTLQAKTTATGGKTGRGGKAGGGNGEGNGGGNKRHRADQEDGEAAKRRKVEEGKQEGVAGV